MIDKDKLIADLFKFYDLLKEQGMSDETLKVVRMCIGIVSTMPKIAR